MKGRVLIIAGSDSGGGAGIQADIKTVTVLGGYASTAITALTAQNTQGVFGIQEVTDSFIAEQIDLVLSDIGADVIKTGMLHNAETIETVDYILESYPDIPLVVDPVMVAKGGALLLEESAIGALKSSLITRAAIVTPNIPEAEVLTGMKIRNVEQMKEAGNTIRGLGAQAVLIKGGHLNDPLLRDVLCTQNGNTVFEHKRLETAHTHGTGCTLASAIACRLAQGQKLEDAVTDARQFVFEAILSAPGFGKGHGPLNHGCRLGITSPQA